MLVLARYHAGFDVKERLFVYGPTFRAINNSLPHFPAAGDPPPARNSSGIERNPPRGPGPGGDAGVCVHNFYRRPGGEVRPGSVGCAAQLSRTETVHHSGAIEGAKGRTHRSGRRDEREPCVSGRQAGGSAVAET